MAELVFDKKRILHVWCRPKEGPNKVQELQRPKKAKSSRKKTRHCLIHINDPHMKFGAILAKFNFSQISLMPFFHRTLQLLLSIHLFGIRFHV